MTQKKITDTKDWNWDRIVTAHAQIVCVMNDMHNVLHNGKCSANMRDRMEARLQDAANDIARIVV